MGTPWDACTYDRSSEPQQAWAVDVLARLEGVAPDTTVLDVGCGTGRVTEALLDLVPRGRVLAMDASADMVELARRRLGERAHVWCQDALELELDEPVDAIVSTAAFHWVPDHDRLWARLADALRPGGVLEIQCGGDGNIDACATPASRRSGAGCRSVRPIRRTWTRSCARRSSPRTSSACPLSAGSRSRRRSSRECACRWTMCA